MPQQKCLPRQAWTGGYVTIGPSGSSSPSADADWGAKRPVRPGRLTASVIPTVPGELFAKFQTSFYADPVDAVFKALGVQ